MSDDPYSDGQFLFSLTQSEVDPKCSWISPNPGRNLAHVNLAFRLVWQGRQNIKKCKDADLKKRMKEAFEDDMASGYDDMYDACEYVKERIDDLEKYNWSTDLGETLSLTHLAGFKMPAGHGQGQWVISGANAHWPDPIYNFRSAVAKRGKMQADALSKLFLPETKAIVDGFDKDAFKGMTAALKSWRSDVDKIDKFAWILDPTAEQEFQFQKAKKRLSYTSALNRLDSVLSQAAKYRDADFDDKTSLAFALLTEAVDFVPVFGTFYGQMLKPLPGFFLAFKNLFRRRLNRQLNP